MTPAREPGALGSSVPDKSAWAGRFRAKAVLLGVFLLFTGIALTLQRVCGAYHGEFNGYPDEPAHYVTGLLIRDYIAQGLPQPPMAFAKNYYLHYPKVALGHWPPLFYMAERSEE